MLYEEDSDNEIDFFEFLDSMSWGAITIMVSALILIGLALYLSVG